jgi:hypothetical protein
VCVRVCLYIPERDREKEREREREREREKERESSQAGALQGDGVVGGPEIPAGERGGVVLIRLYNLMILIT